jgi:hypothetical protein
MDRDQFDRLARTPVSHVTRRRLGELLLAFGVGSAAVFHPLRSEEAGARKNRRKRRKKRRCRPKRAGKICGGDGCGGSCGGCGILSVCLNGACKPICTPDCTGKTCGSDGCLGSCGMCFLPFVCKENGTCGF